MRGRNRRNPVFVASMAFEVDNHRQNLVRDFLANITQWASTQDDIGAVALVGSFARNTATADSDVDLVLLTMHWPQYVRDKKWIKLFGEVERDQIEDYGKVTSLRVWYKNGLEVEYGFADEAWAAVPLDAGTQSVIADGFVLLFARDNLLSEHLNHEARD